MARRAEAKVYIVGDTRGFHTAMRRATWSAMTFGAKMRAIGGTMQSVGKRMTMGLTLPIVAMGVAAVKVAADFDKAMTNSTAIMGKMSDKMRKQMETTARTVAKTTTFTHTEAAESYFYLASAGLSAAQSIKALPKVAKFAQAGNFDMAKATDLLTDAQSALGLQVKNTTKNMENMTRVGDVLVKANVLANATTEQFSEALTNKAGASMRLLNKDIEEGTAVLAVYANQGLKGAAAGTALSMVLRDLQKASMKAPKAWKKFGASVYDADGKMRNIADIIADLEDGFEGMSDKQKRAALTSLGFTDKSIAATQALLGESDAIRKYEQDLRKAGGTTEKVSKKQLESFSAKMALLKSQFQDVGISIGTMLMPHLEKFGRWLSKAAKWFGDLSEGTQETILKLALLLAALGPINYVGGTLIKTLSTMVTLYKGIAKYAGLAAGAQTKFGASSGAAAAGGAGKGAATAGRVFSVGAGGAATTTVSTLGGFSMSALATAAAGIALMAATPLVIAGIADKVAPESGKSEAALGARGSASDAFRAQVAGSSTQAAQKRGAKTIQQMIIDLQVKGATKAGADMGKLVKQMELLQTVASDPILLGELEGEHTVQQLQDIERDMMKRLGIGKKQADKIMASMFKEWNPSAVLNPKIDKAAVKAERRIQTLRERAAKQIKFGNPDITGLINAISRVSSAFNNMGSAARTAGSAATNALLRSQGATGGGKFEANGDIIRSRQTVTVGEAGPEVIIPLTRPRRAAQLMQQAGLAGPGGGAVTVNVVMPTGSTIIGMAADVGNALAPHVARALRRESARAGRRR